MNDSTNPDSALVDEAVHLLRDASAAGDSYNILFSVGEGERSAAAADAIRQALASESHVAFSEVSNVPGEPVEDSDEPGSHVHQQGFAIDPPPHVVVRISESDDVLYIAARPAGPDPLGAPSGDWLWVLPKP